MYPSKRLRPSLSMLKIVVRSIHLIRSIIFNLSKQKITLTSNTLIVQKFQMKVDAIRINCSYVLSN